MCNDVSPRQGNGIRSIRLGDFSCMWSIVTNHVGYGFWLLVGSLKLGWLIKLLLSSTLSVPKLRILLVLSLLHCLPYTTLPAPSSRPCNSARVYVTTIQLACSKGNIQPNYFLCGVQSVFNREIQYKLSVVWQKPYQVIECLTSRQGTANGVDRRSILLCSIEKRRIDSDYICSLGRGRRTSLFFSTAGLQLSWAKCPAAPIWLHFHCLCLQPGSPYALTQCLAKKRNQSAIQNLLKLDC